MNEKDSLIKTIEKQYKKKELEKAKQFCYKHNIDYYTFLSEGCNKNIIADLMTRGNYE